MKKVVFFAAGMCVAGGLVLAGIVVGLQLRSADSGPGTSSDAHSPEPSVVEDTAIEAALLRKLPETVENFRLLDHQGRSHELFRQRGSRAVVLYTVGNGCPIVRQSVPRLKELRDAYAAQNVVFWCLNAFTQDDRESVAREAREYEIDIPVLLDEAQLVTAGLGTARTGEALLVNPVDWRIEYRGALDDRLDYGAKQQTAKRHWLKDALDAFLLGEAIEHRQTETKGCLITRSIPEQGFTYTAHVAPILEGKCIRCHSEGQVAPFAFKDYANVKGWGSMMREVVRTRRMPPWYADTQVGRFTNDCSLTPFEAQALAGWVEGGMPRGEGEDVLATRLAPRMTEWPLGEPDMVVELPEEMSIPARGEFDYKYIRVPFTLDRDAWVRAVDVRPTNFEVVHHVLVFVRYPGALRRQQHDMRGGLEGYFGGYVPGAQPVPFPEGTGKWLPRGTRFVFQLHYNATGKAETDRTRMGLYFHDEKPPLELQTRTAHTEDFAIPPGAREYEVSASHRIREDVILWSLNPHMHYRGSRVAYDAHYPDGRVETLLSVPNYNFDWQMLYELEEPLRLPSGTVIVCRGAFDNSATNPFNPDPEQRVHFGEQTWDEMFIGYMNYSPAT